MATPRKHWFKVQDSIGREDLSNDELATMIRLMSALNTQWARDGLTNEEACRIALRPADLMALTGSGSLTRARRVAHALAVNVSLIVTEVAKQTIIEWPKWSEIQYPDAPKRGNSRETQGQKSPPPQDARRKTQDSDARQKKEPPSAPSASRKSPQVAFPGSMTPDDWKSVAETHGIDARDLFAAARDWAGEADRRYAAKGWRLAIGRALKNRWDWTRPLFDRGRSDQRPQNHGERVSQFNRESAAEAFRQMTEGAGGDGSAPFLALDGGKS